MYEPSDTLTESSVTSTIGGPDDVGASVGVVTAVSGGPGGVDAPVDDPEGSLIGVGVPLDDPEDWGATVSPPEATPFEVPLPAK
jgi:hypothetical protein